MVKWNDRTRRFTISRRIHRTPGADDRIRRSETDARNPETSQAIDLRRSPPASDRYFRHTTKLYMHITVSDQQEEEKDTQTVHTSPHFAPTHHDDADIPSSPPNAGREALHLPAKRKKGKNKLVKREVGDSCVAVTEIVYSHVCRPLLNLPPDVLAPLIALLPPRALLQVQLVCRQLRGLLKGDTIWREAFLNRFLYSGATKFGSPSPALGLVRTCLYNTEKGWRREGLARENMLE